jgi:tRNA threonylcarbamoyladenosine biosynthesis protein TsaE
MDRSSAAPAPADAGTLRSDSPEQTRAVGRAIGVLASAGTFVALVGELGAGKTQLAKGLADGLGVTGVVNSPTFVLMNEHVGRLRLHHVDAYRLADPEEAAAAGLLDEREGEGVVVLEWADRLAGWLPNDRLEIALSPIPGEPSARQLRWRAIGDAHARLAAEALQGA